MKNNKIILVASIYSFLCLFAAAVNAAPPLPGAIFTTDSQGAIVNGNTKYGSKCGATGVWLDGGPGPNAPQTAAGLPDGDYYFQVTGPSGKKLLSTDPVQDRCITVQNGVISGNCALPGPPGPGDHNTLPDMDAGPGVVVELCEPGIPFLDTPNPGGVYKAWITPVGDGTVTGGGFVGDPTQVDNSCGNGCFHGFLPARSKTDNFKVSDTRTFCIKVNKQVVAKKGTAPGVGWLIGLTEPLGSTSFKYTDGDGNLEWCGLLPGFYEVEEDLQGGFVLLDTAVDGKSVGAQNPVTVQLKNGDKNDAVFIQFTNDECGKDCPK